MGGECFESTCFYVVPFVDGNDKIQTLKATGVARITSFGASDPPHDIEGRFPLAKGWAERLARAAGEVDLLIGLDNQRWMPRHVSSSIIEGDNLRMITSVLGPARASLDKQGEWRVRGTSDRGSGCLKKMMVMAAVLLAVGTTRATAFKAFDCNNGSAPIEQYSLLDPEPCWNMQKVHTVERDLHGEIVQINKERLVQVTKCIVVETITSTFCGFQSRAGVLDT